MSVLIRIIRFMGFFTAIIIVLLILALVLATLTDYRPSGSEALAIEGKSHLTKLKNNEITLLTWNIGYGGLGKAMDFFYEGGKQVRPGIENFHKYMNGIGSVVESNNQVDFFLLQEVDKKAKRSHWKNQVEFLGQILKSHNYVFAKNYDVPFVPVPLNQPMGRVLAGLVNFAACNAATSERVSFPGDLGWPNSLFLLDRCYLIQRFITVDSKVLVVINTHNSAFDKGEKRKKQLDMLKITALNEYNNGNYIVIGGDWNLNPPGFNSSQISNGDCASASDIGSIDAQIFPSDWTWAYDEKTPTNRQVNAPYRKGETMTTILDFFLLSPNIELLEVQTTDLGFEHSDHNPVKVRIRLK